MIARADALGAASAAFAGLDLSAYPDVHRYEEELDAVLWVLHVARENAIADWLSAAEASDILRDICGLVVTRQRVASLLGRARPLVAQRRSAREASYSIMKPGVDRVMRALSDVVIVDPDEAFTGLQRVETVLTSLTGEILLCDPYVNGETLTRLTSIGKSSPIRLLTVNISEPSRFRSRLHAYSREFGNLELRLDARGDIHDRYVLDDSSLWLLGTSLNGLGKKQSILARLGSSSRTTVRAAFQARWNRAAAWK